MCDSKGRWLSYLNWGLVGGLINETTRRRADKKHTAELNSINANIEKLKKTPEEQAQLNTPQSTQEAQQKPQQQLTTQKVPLNTGSTGATIGSPTTVGLNLGGY